MKKYIVKKNVDWSIAYKKVNFPLDKVFSEDEYASDIVKEMEELGYIEECKIGNKEDVPKEDEKKTSGENPEGLKETTESPVIPSGSNISNNSEDITDSLTDEEKQKLADDAELIDNPENLKSSERDSNDTQNNKEDGENLEHKTENENTDEEKNKDSLITENKNLGDPQENKSKKKNKKNK